MRRRACCKILLLSLALIAGSPPLSGHPSFNIAVDARGNVYFIDVFKNHLLKVAPDGSVSTLVDLRTKAPGVRMHALTLGVQGDLFLGGHKQRKVWRFSPTGKILPFDPIRGLGVPSRGVLHLGFDAAGVLYMLDWHHGAPRKAQRFSILKSGGGKKPPVEIFASRGKDEDFIDFHTGSMLVAGDGTVYFSNAHRIWKLGAGRKLVLVAGAAAKGHVDGIGPAARFESPYGMCTDRDGTLLVAERAGRIRRVGAKGRVTTFAGSGRQGHVDGPRLKARFAGIIGVGVGPHRRVYAVEYEDKREYRVRVISADRVTTLARHPCDGLFAN